jgi:tryptophanyl-tRNA synthetase
MNRMTQFKDKTQRKSAEEVAMLAIEQLRNEMKEEYWTNDDIERVINARISQLNEISKATASIGLFNYPVLMAADILLYGATYVPVGDDQTQHLEFARDISTRLNTQFGELFVVPKAVKEQHQFFGKDQGLRIKDLADPAKKMSKSDETGKGVIFLTDTPDVARKKVMSATTDSLGQINYDYDKQPGVSSLIDLMALLKGVDKQEVIDQYGGQTMYGPFKTEVADIVANFLTDFQTKLAAVDDKVLLAKLEFYEKLMNEQANATLLAVQQAVGLRSKK